jgi:peptide methionine sulfoxide reductase MsrA
MRWIEHFYRTHDPTTKDRQGVDEGTRMYIEFMVLD